MAQLDVRRLYASGVAPTKEQLDAFVDDIETFINLTKLNDDNIQAAGITASDKFVDGTVTTAKFQNSAVTTAKIADDAVTTAKVADDAVTTAVLADSSVTTAKLADASITTDKIAGGAVTPPKIAGNLQISSSFNSTGTGTIESVSITTTGGPILIGIMQNAGSGLCYCEATLSDSSSGSPISTQPTIILKRGSTTLATIQKNNDAALTSSAYMQSLVIPLGAMQYLDAQAAGTYTYSVSVAYGGGTNSGRIVGALYAMELH